MKMEIIKKIKIKIKNKIIIIITTNKKIEITKLHQFR